MKKLAKLMCFSLALLLTFSLGVTNVSAAPAEAEPKVEVTEGEQNPGGNEGNSESGEGEDQSEKPTTGSLTLKVTPDTDKTDEELTATKYAAYQVLAAKHVDGQDSLEYEYSDDFKAFETEYKTSVEAIYKMKSGEANAHITADSVDQLASQLEKYIADNSIVATKKDISLDTKVEGLGIGYYLILETETPDTYKETKPMLIAIPEDITTEGDNEKKYKYDVEVTVKDQPITTTKSIVETENSQEVLKDSIAEQVGKEVTFKIVQDVPKYDDSYNDVVFKVTDTMSKGLEFVEITSVEKQTGTNPLVKLLEGQYGFDKSEKDPQTGKTTLTFDFSKNAAVNGTDYYTNVKDADQVIITYTAKLNADANFGSTGNPNEAAAEFGNDPSNITNGKKDITATYAGTLELVKQDAALEQGETEHKKLPGAEFTVYIDPECKTEATLVTYTVDEDGAITTTPATELSATATTDKNGIARFSGLGAGTYYIKETKSPNGYILLKEPIQLTVTVKLPGAVETGNEKAEFTYSVTEVDGITSNTDNNKVTITVNNTKGFTLPTTGGMGTYLFTVGGALLIIAAVVLIAAKKKKH